MIKKGFVIILFVFLSAYSGNAGAEQQSDFLKKCRESFSRDFPGTLQVEITKAPVDGLCEIHAGTNVYYYAPATIGEKSGYLIIGALYNSDGNNLTEQSQSRLIAKAAASLPIQQAIKIGRGPVKVIEFTDPDCPFCRRLEGFFDSRPELSQKITRYVFLHPLVRLHPNADKKAVWILCQKDKPVALKQVMIEKSLDKTLIDVPTDCNNAKIKEHLFASQKGWKILGLRGTPVLLVGPRVIRGLQPAVIEKAINEAFRASKIQNYKKEVSS